MVSKTIDVYIDHKSPYAYLAIDPLWTFERDFDVHLNWLPLALDIASYRGSAEVDDDRKVLTEDRTAYQWRRVRYTYMDARRYANLRGMTIRGTQKIWDSSLAAIGLLYAKKFDLVRQYNDIVYERFWRRELDIESITEIGGVLREIGVNKTDFAAYAAHEGRRAFQSIQAEADSAGVFGVPTILLDGEVFWGREQFSLVRLILSQQGLTRKDASVPTDITYAWRPGGPGYDP